MPWKTRSDHPDCPNGVAVVKSDTGAFVACHENQAEADAHVAALYANMPEYRNKRLAEFRDAELAGHHFRGLAAVFDTPWSEALTDAMGYVETVAKGAFRKVLSSTENVPLLGEHHNLFLLASTRGGTLELKEDPRGVRVEADLPKNYLGEYYREMIERGDIQGMSYGFETLPGDNIFVRKNGTMHRTIANIQRLLDVTLTWNPAYPATEVELRAAGFVATSQQEIPAGVEAQDGEAAAVEPPDTDQAGSVLEARLAEMRIRQLEGGFKL